MFYNMTWLERILFLKRIKASGNPMHEATSTSGSFVTDVVAPLKKLLLTLSPIQSGSGTPSPSNPRPISGHTEVDTEVCGKNLMESVAYATALYSAVPYRQSGTAISSPYTTTADWSGVGFFAPVKAGITYSFSSDLAESGTFFYGIYMDFADTINRNNVLESGRLYSNTFTPSYDGCVVVMHYAQTAGTTMEWNYAQLEVGSSATSYEPYQGTSYTTTLGRTVYGGTLDVVSGELVVDRAMVDLGSLTWQSAWNGFATRSITNAVYPLESIAMNILSDRYPTVSYVNRADKTIYGADPNGQGNANFVAVQDSTYASVAEFKTAMNGVMLCYELATPQTYQLTPQQINSLVGQNNIITEDGVEVDEIVYMTRLVGSPLLGSPQTEEPTEETDEPIEETEEPEGE